MFAHNPLIILLRFGMFVAIKKSFSNCEAERGARIKLTAWTNEKKKLVCHSNLLRSLTNWPWLEKQSTKCSSAISRSRLIERAVLKRVVVVEKSKLRLFNLFFFIVSRLRWCLEPLPLLPDLRTQWVDSRLNRATIRHANKSFIEILLG